MTDTGDRTITFYESDADLTNLSKNGYNLVVAQKVLSSNGTAKANLVWQSLALAPSMEVSWKVQYALAWVSKLPTSGASVTLRGKWQPCLKGESYDINEFGLWIQSADTSQADPAFLNVGKVAYSYPGSPIGVHIVVGVLNSATNKYEPIFVDESGIMVNGNAKYQPQESAQFWYQAGISNASMITSLRGKVGEQNTASPGASGKYEWWATFLVPQGRWGSSSEPPPSTYLALPASEADFSEPETAIAIGFLSGKQIITFVIAIAASARKQVADAIKSALLASLPSTKTLSVTWQGQDGKSILIEYKSGPSEVAPSNFIIAIGGDGGNSDIEKALQSAKKYMPDGETWTIEDLA